MKFTRCELKCIRNHLLVKQAYRGVEANLGAVVWEPWMQNTLDRVEEELDRTSYIKDDHQILS